MKPSLPQRGFTLVEVMVAMTISLVVLSALVSIFVNLSQSHREMEKTNGVIENGRFALQILENDIVHAGYWGGHVPLFDDLGSSIVPGDVPTATANPCIDYSAWTSAYRLALIGHPVQTFTTLPTGTGCLSPLTQRAGTDVLVARHADTCVPGETNCEADVAGRVYLQPSFCAAERNAGTAQTASADTIKLGMNASMTNDAYVNFAIRAVSGAGAGQVRFITDYDATTRVATISTPWTVIPNGTTAYAFDYVLSTQDFSLHKMDCVGTGSPESLPVMAGAIAEKRRFISNLYYIADIPHPDQAGEVLPALVRSQLDFASGTVAQQPPVRLIDGIENLRIELGIDDRSETGAAVNYTQAVTWADPSTLSQPTNRGDGTPDRFVRCTTATPCSATDLANVVAVKIYLLARSRDITPGHVDSKTYCLGEPAADGSCPTANTIAATNDQYKRHVFTTSVRLTNVSGRRETP
jgi:prepilin-type N-terminal cleavage/methylation domain-containing protein